MPRTTSLPEFVAAALVILRMRGPLPRYASGVLYLGLGVGTALAGRRQ